MIQPIPNQSKFPMTWCLMDLLYLRQSLTQILVMMPIDFRCTLIDFGTHHIFETLIFDGLCIHHRSQTQFSEPFFYCLRDFICGSNQRSVFMRTLDKRIMPLSRPRPFRIKGAFLAHPLRTDMKLSSQNVWRKRGLYRSFSTYSPRTCSKASWGGCTCNVVKTFTSQNRTNRICGKQMLNQFLKNTNQVSCHFGTITQLSRLVLQGTQTQFPVGAQVSKKNSFFPPNKGSSSRYYWDACRPSDTFCQLERWM